MMIVLIVVGVVIVVFGGMALLLLPAVGSARDAAQRATCRNNLKQIGMANHLYHDVYNRLPAAYTADAQGQPLLSWRVAILPHVEQNRLHQSIDHKQPWNSQHNSAYNSLDIAPFHCPAAKDSHAPGETEYLAVVGPKTVFPGSQKVRFGDIKDGLANTIMLVETTGQNINWMEPRDLDFNRVQLSQLQGPHPHGVHVLLCDGSVHFVESGKMDDAAFKAMLTRDGGERVPSIR